MLSWTLYTPAFADWLVPLYSAAYWRCDPRRPLPLPACACSTPWDVALELPATALLSAELLCVTEPLLAPGLNTDTGA